MEAVKSRKTNKSDFLYDIYKTNKDRILSRPFRAHVNWTGPCADVFTTQEHSSSRADPINNFVASDFQVRNSLPAVKSVKRGKSCQTYINATVAVHDLPGAVFGLALIGDYSQYGDELQGKSFTNQLPSIEESSGENAAVADIAEG